MTRVSNLLLAAGLALAFFVACKDDAASAPRTSSTVPDDASPPDAGSIDAARPLADAADAEVDPCTGRVICDSFESAASGAKPNAPWKVLENSGTVAVSTTRAHSGKQSLKLTTTANQYQRAMITTAGAPLFPLAGNILYGRMYAWLENAAGHDVHWNMISASGPVPNKTNVSASYNYGGQLDTLLANYDTKGASTDCWKHSKTAMPIGKWVCFAWKLAGPTNELQLFTDSGELADMHVTNKGEGCLANDLGGVWSAPAFANASVGWESVQNDPGHTMYIDDVIFDDKPLTCP